MARSFCWARQRLASTGSANTADAARSARYSSKNIPASSSIIRLKEISTRCGGQKTVTTAWLLPANSATATAMPNRAMNQRAARIGRLLLSVTAPSGP